MDHVIGIGLSAGCGVRFRPLTLKARGYLRAKGAIRFLGRRVLDWLVDILQHQGIIDFIMVTKGKENRYQIKSIVGYGERLGVRVRYSPVRFDVDNTGSADAVLTNLEYYDVRDTAFVFPTDSVLDIDLPGMMAAHQRAGAVVTIAAALQPAESIAQQYGLIDHSENGRVRGFVEKPPLEEIYRRYGMTGQSHMSLQALPTNAGFYLMDSLALREIARHPDICQMRKRQLDIGGDLLPWLVQNNFPVIAYPIGRMGDLGNIPSYLQTMVDVLHGRFACVNALVPQVCPGGEHVLIDPESLELTDPLSRLSLARKIEQGMVVIHPPVRVGKYVRIYPGVTLSECNVDDDCEIFENATIIRSSIGAGSIVGPYTYMEDALTGIMVELQSSGEHPVSLTRYVAVGDEVILRAGVTLRDSISIYPRIKVPTNSAIPPCTEIESIDQLLEFV